MKRSLDAAYRQHRHDIRRAARRHAARYRQERDEIEAEANLLFVQACRTLDLDRGPLKPRVRSFLDLRLMDRQRKEASRHMLLPRAWVVLEDIHAPDYDTKLLLARLNPDAALLVRLALGCDWNENPRSLRRQLRLSLRQLGWSHFRINRAFREIQEAIT